MALHKPAAGEDGAGLYLCAVVGRANLWTNQSNNWNSLKIQLGGSNVSKGSEVSNGSIVSNRTPLMLLPLLPLLPLFLASANAKWLKDYPDCGDAG